MEISKKQIVSKIELNDSLILLSQLSREKIQKLTNLIQRGEDLSSYLQIFTSKYCIFNQERNQYLLSFNDQESKDNREDFLLFNYYIDHSFPSKPIELAVGGVYNGEVNLLRERFPFPDDSAFSPSIIVLPDCKFFGINGEKNIEEEKKKMEEQKEQFILPKQEIIPIDYTEGVTGILDENYNRVRHTLESGENVYKKLELLLEKY